MKRLVLCFLVLLITSCIPLRIAPTIKTDKVMIAKKFKRKLPKRNAFIFEDPKDANEFYNYVNTKYELNHQDVEWNVPFIVGGKPFYFSFHEVEILDKTVNIIPLVVDTALEKKGWDPMLEDAHVSRSGNWYLVITVSDDEIEDCLREGYEDRAAILKYLRYLRTEYLNTSNYLDVLFRK